MCCWVNNTHMHILLGDTRAQKACPGWKANKHKAKLPAFDDHYIPNPVPLPPVSARLPLWLPSPSATLPPTLTPAPAPKAQGSSRAGRLSTLCTYSPSLVSLKWLQERGQPCPGDPHRGRDSWGQCAGDTYTHTHAHKCMHTWDRTEQLQPRCWRCAVQQDSLGASMVQHGSAVLCSPLFWVTYSALRCEM